MSVPAPASAQVHRRAFVDRTSPLSPTYTHLSPCAAGSPPSFLFASTSSATYVTSHSVQHTLTPPLHSDPLSAIALTPDASIAILAHRSGNVRFHTLPPTAEPARTIRPFRDVNVVSLIAVHPSSRYIAFAAADGAIRVHDLETLALTHTLSTPTPLTAISFPPSEDTTVLIAGCDDGALRLFDLREKTSTSVASLRPHVARVAALAFVHHDTLVSVSPDATLAIVRVTSRNLTQTALLTAGESLMAAAPLSHGRVAVAAARGALRIWNVESRSERKQDALHLPFVSIAGTDPNEGDEDETDATAIAYVVPTRDDSLIVALSDHTVLSVRAVHSEAPQLLPEARCGNLEEIYDVAALPGGREVAIASNSATVWLATLPDVATSKEWTPVAALPGHTANVLALHTVPVPAAAPLAAVDLVLASASRDRSARVWARARESGAWAAVAVADGHTDPVAAVALSPRLATGSAFLVSGGADRTLKLWSLDATLKKHCKRIAQMVSDMEPVAEQFHIGCTDGSVQLSAQWTVLAHEKDINAVAISPDARFVATGSQDKTLKIWTAEKGTVHATCTGHRRGIWSVAFSSVDRVIVSASGDSSVRIWSVQNGSCLRTLQGHLAGVLRARFASRGTQIISSGADGLVKVWTTKSGECDATLDAHDDRVWALDCAEDGGRLISGAADGLVKVWTDTTVEEETAAAKKREEEALMEQVVDNAARGKKWTVAAKGALELNMTQKLKSIITSLLTSSDDPEEDLSRVISGLLDGDADEENRTDEEREEVEKAKWQLVGRLFLCCRDWNASGGAKSAAVAAYVLKALFGMWTPQTLCDKLPGEKRALVEALEAHCGRHLERVNELSVKACVLEHTLTSMQALSVLDVRMDADKSLEEIEKPKVGSVKSAKSLPKSQPKATVVTKPGKAVKRKRKPREEVQADY